MRVPALLSILFLFLLVATAAASSRYEPAAEPAAEPVAGEPLHQWTLGAFTLRVEPLPDSGDMGGAWLVRVLRDGAEVMEPLESWMMEPSFAGPLADTPGPGCELAVATTYSGGAHCCFEDIVLVSCPDRDMASRVALGDSEAGEPRAKGRLVVLPVTDWSLAYYGPPNGEDLFIPFAYSPAMPRFLIHTPEGWRSDRPGEFPGFHAGVRAEAEREEQDPEFPALSIKAAYHAYMVAGDKETARQVLAARLPEPWRPHADDILADIVKRAEDFNPVENRVFPK